MHWFKSTRLMQRCAFKNTTKAGYLIQQETSSFEFSIPFRLWGHFYKRRRLDAGESSYSVELRLMNSKPNWRTDISATPQHAWIMKSLPCLELGCLTGAVCSKTKNRGFFPLNKRLNPGVLLSVVQKLLKAFKTSRRSWSKSMRCTSNRRITAGQL